MMSKTYELRVPSCGRAAAERILMKKFPRVPVPDAVKIMRDRRKRKSSRSSQKSQWKKESEY
jgi:hypothetical protein